MVLGRVLPQLRAFRSLLLYLTSPGQERTLTAFAATVAMPAELLHWLEAMCLAVRLGIHTGKQCAAPCWPAVQRTALNPTALACPALPLSWMCWAAGPGLAAVPFLQA
jgi:hypothetical protein